MQAHCHDSALVRMLNARQRPPKLCVVTACTSNHTARQPDVKYSVLSGTGAGRVPGSSQVSARRVPNFVSRLARGPGRALYAVTNMEVPIARGNALANPTKCRDSLHRPRPFALERAPGAQANRTRGSRPSALIINHLVMQRVRSCVSVASFSSFGCRR
jgi:hypothetical protein